MSTEKLGDKLRRLRNEKKLPLRKVAALADIDVAILSKMERGERKLSKDIVLKLAEIYKHDPDELVIMYLSEKILYEIGDEELASKALLMAEESVAYQRAPQTNKEAIIESLKQYFKKDKRLKAAWIFGSFVRGDMHTNSDIDIMVRLDPSVKITFFDLGDIAAQLEKITNRKIDLVEEGMLSPFALKTAQQDLISIYG